jgi:broad specificity phosphatase PhoE
MSARVADRQKRRQERAERRQQGAAPPSLPDRLDRAAQRIGERLKAFNTVFKPFYASLTDEQKSLARVVLREATGGGHGFHRRWARHDAPPPTQQ